MKPNTGKVKRSDEIEDRNIEVKQVECDNTIKIQIPIHKIFERKGKNCTLVFLGVTF